MPSIAVLKSLLQNQIAPNSDEEFLRLISEADLRIAEWGARFWFLRSKLTLTPTDGLIELPLTHVSILGAQVGDYPASVFAMEHEFVPDGVGDVDVGGPGGIRLIDQGVDDDTGKRVYKITGYLNPGTVITVLATKAPVTLYDPEIASSDVPEDATDVTLCPDVSALKLTALGIIYEETNDLQKSREYFSIALSNLDGKEKTHRGNARQTVNIRPSGPGISRIRNPR